MILTPNYTKALNTSIKVLRKYKLNRVPIDIMQIVNQIPNLKVCSYSYFSKEYGCSVDEVIEFLETNLGAISRDPKTNNYIIYYNDTKGNEGLNRFTIAHELGHYFLGHFKFITKQVLNREGLTSSRYKAIENEANCFARNLLSPVPLYKLVPQDPLTFNWIVMDTFNISYEASIARSKFLRLDNYRMTKDHLRYFSTYKMPYYEHCEQCKNPEIKGASYCGVCGVYIIDEDSYFKVTYILERSDYMIYDGIEVDEHSKANVCPECLNEEPETGEFCSICSTHLVNRCTNGMDNPWRNDQNESPCGKLLSGNARYCTHCGSKSTFLQNKILSPWIKSLEKDVVKLGIHGELESASDSDDDIPF